MPNRVVTNVWRRRWGVHVVDLVIALADQPGRVSDLAEQPVDPRV
jgi:hypothetical protein